jgi:hypothetical protein
MHGGDCVRPVFKHKNPDTPDAIIRANHSLHFHIQISFINSSMQALTTKENTHEKASHCLSGLFADRQFFRQRFGFGCTE